MYKKGRYIVARILGFLAIVLLGAVLAVQTPRVQKMLAGKVLDRFAVDMDGLVKYDELHIMPNGVLMLRNARIIDSNPSEKGDSVFASAGTITATFTIKGLFNNEGIHLGRVTVEDGYMHLDSEDNIYHSNLNRLFGIEAKPLRDTIPAPGPDIFDVKKVLVKNFRFRLTDHRKPHYKRNDTGIDYQDIDVTADLRAHSVKMSGGRMSGVADKVTLKEKSGYEAYSLTGRCIAGQGEVMIEDLHLTDPWSDISLRFYSMTFESMAAFSNYVDNTVMEGEFRPSKVAMESIKYFAGTFEGNKSVFDISRGHVKGTVNDLSVDNLVFSDSYSGVRGSAECRIQDVTEIKDFPIEARATKFRCTAKGLGLFLSGFSTGAPLDFSAIIPGQEITVDATARGSLNNISVKASIASGIGGADLEGTVKDIIERRSPIGISATLNTSRLDLGRILKNSSIGECTMELKGETILKKGLPEIILDTLAVSSILAFGNEYNGLTAKGSLTGGTAEGWISCPDPDLDIDIKALADLLERPEGRRFYAEGELSGVDITPFNIVAAEGRSTLRATLNADLAQKDGILDGNAVINGLTVTQGGADHMLGDIVISASPSEDRHNIKISSGFLDATYTGTRPANGFIRDIVDISVGRDLPALVKRPASGESCGEYGLDVRFNDSRDILSLLAPGIYLADSTMVSINVDASGEMAGNVTSDRLAFGKNYLRLADLSFDNRNGSLNLDLAGEDLKAGPVTLALPEISIFAEDNAFSADFKFDNSAEDGNTAEGIFQLEGLVQRDSTGTLGVTTHAVDSYMVLAGNTWNLNESDIVLSKGSFRTEKFTISHDDQYLLIDGGYSNIKNDTLSLKLNRLDMAILDEFLNGYGFEGTLDGSASMSKSPGSSIEMFMDINAGDLRLGGIAAGDIHLASTWDESRQAIGIDINDNLDGRDILKAGGHYFPTSNELEITAGIDRLPLNIAKAFLKNIFTEIDGDISGRISMIGPMESISTSSRDLRLNNARLTLGLTGVSYSVDGPMRITNNGLFFEPLTITDDDRGSGTLTGGLRFDHLQDLALDARVSVNSIKALDADERDNSSFYGKLAISGDAAVTGPMESISIDANVRTSGDGDVHIPVSGKMMSSTSDLLTFTEPQKEIDPYEEMLETYTVTSSRRNDMIVKARVSIDEGTRAYVEIDKETGNMASFNGSGDVNLTIRPSRDVFNINGDYRINEGKYKFVLQGILAKDFNIQNGSTVQFGGNLSETNLNIDATHNVRTTLTPVLTERSSDVSTRRLVECGISITDRLSRPQIDFTVNVPDLDPSTKSEVDAALNTPDKVQKQFIALLLMNSFIPSETSGVFNGTNMIFSSVSELMSNQINSIFQKLEIPVDVGFGYQNSSTGSDMFDVAISTQLFNNRVIVGGSVGNRKYTSSASNSDFVGDLDIQIKLDPKGQFRLNMFSHSADEFTNFLDNSQRNGVGVSYQREYNRISDFFRNIFSPEKEKDVPESAVPSEDIVIKIENEQRKTLPDTLTVR